MCNILLSINPQYVNRIIKGDKRFEFRTKIAKKKVDKIVFYSTNPIKKVVGEVEVLSVKSGSPRQLWQITEGYAGISKELFKKYFKHRETAYAYELGKVKVYDEPKDISEYGCNHPPQSFIYLD